MRIIPALVLNQELIEVRFHTALAPVLRALATAVVHVLEALATLVTIDHVLEAPIDPAILVCVSEVRKVPVDPAAPPVLFRLKKSQAPVLIGLDLHLFIIRVPLETEALQTVLITGHRISFRTQAHALSPKVKILPLYQLTISKTLSMTKR